MKVTTKLRNLLKGPDVIMSPCAIDALTAKLIEQAGFKLIGTTGNGIHGAMLGTPDNGTLSSIEMISVCRNISAAVDIPVFADAEAGYGNAINVIRTVSEFERAGVAGIFIEDQKLPSSCPFVTKPELISTEEMVGKIKAAIKTRKDPDFVICARSDAPFDEAVARAQAYIEAGADMIKIVPKNRKELEMLPQKVNAPLHLGFVSGKDIHNGLTAFDAGKMGYKIVTFPQVLYYLAIKAQQAGLHDLLTSGSDDVLADRMINMDTYLKVVDAEKFTNYRQMFLHE